MRQDPTVILMFQTASLQEVPKGIWMGVFGATSLGASLAPGNNLSVVFYVFL